MHGSFMNSESTDTGAAGLAALAVAPSSNVVTDADCDMRRTSVGVVVPP
jgi:hypothetical protein